MDVKFYLTRSKLFHSWDMARHFILTAINNHGKEIVCLF